MPEGAGQRSEGGSADKLRGPYLLATPIPVKRFGDGWAASQLWAKDLLLHLPYMDEFVLAAPVAEELSASEPVVPIPATGPNARLRVVALPPMTSVLGTLLRMPVTLARLWREIGRARIVHCGIGGWPIPFGWFVVPMTKMRGKFLIIIVESAAWRSVPAHERGLRRLKLRFKAGLYEVMGRWCVRKADAAFFTHSEYQTAFPPRHPSPEHVLQASWIDEGDILSDAQAAELWRGKGADGSRPVRVVFVGRLTVAKGLLLLLDVIRDLRARGVAVELDIFGFGELEPQCRAAAEAANSGVKFRGTLPYGPEFFRAIRGYDAVVVPSLSDEQPRIVFDAFSQAVPILASGTMGHRECVTEGKNGLLFKVDDAAALGACIERVARERGVLAELGMASVVAARAHTHQAMHRRRFELIKRAMAR